MKKRVGSLLTAIVAVSLMLAGCSGTEMQTDWDAPLFSQRPIPVTIVEPVAATVAAGPVSVAYPQTPEVEQPVGFQAGDTAWIVLHRDDIGPAEVKGAVVIAEITGYLITSPQYCGEGTDWELMWELVLRSDDGRQCLDIWPIGDCYRSQGAAQDAADQENGHGM